MKAFEFRFRREPADFPEPDFVPFIWKRKGDDNDGPGNGNDHEDAMNTSESSVAPKDVNPSQG